MAKAPTAKKTKDITRYAGDVGLFHLSRGIKRGAMTFKYIIVAKHSPRSGKNNISVWLSDDDGAIKFVEPYKEFRADSIQDALTFLGYDLV